MSVAVWIGAYLVVGFVVAVILAFALRLEDEPECLAAAVVAWPAFLLFLALGSVGNGAAWCSEKLHAYLQRRRDWKETLRWRALHPDWEAKFKERQRRAEQAARARP